MITDFANKYQASLTEMQDGEHWFHTEEQIRFLDRWIEKKPYSYPSLRYQEGSESQRLCCLYGKGVS